VNIVDFVGVAFAYPQQKGGVEIPQLQILKGEKVFLYGPSGSGKTTLLGLITGILSPQLVVGQEGARGQVLGQDWVRLSLGEKDRVRGAQMGYIFQQFNLIPHLTVEENIVLPCTLHKERLARLQGVSPRDEARRLAQYLGIEETLGEKAHRLSVGQQQRVAAARAFMGSPDLILADEPTSALDIQAKESFLELLFAFKGQGPQTLIFVSHDLSLSKHFTQSVAINDVFRRVAP